MMKKVVLYGLVFLTAALVCLALISGIFRYPAEQKPPVSSSAGERILLPPPQSDGVFSVEKALAERRSVRYYAPRSIRQSDISQLLWACQGISGPGGLRTAPSAGALYPLEVYLVAGEVEGLSPGIYHYLPADNVLETIRSGDYRADLSLSALNQPAVREAPAVLVITAVYNRTTGKYSERGIRYVHMEAGHAAQNVYLQAIPLGMGTVSIGAFHDGELQKILSRDGEAPLYVMPVGYLQ
jgi:SagB-type dehydrogenase family enzyme